MIPIGAAEVSSFLIKYYINHLSLKLQLAKTEEYSSCVNPQVLHNFPIALHTFLLVRLLLVAFGAKVAVHARLEKNRAR